VSRWMNILLRGDPELPWHSIAGVPTAPIAIGFEIPVEIEGPQAIALLVNQPRLDLGGDAVPVTIDRRRKRARARSRCAQLTLAQVARDSFDIAPGCVHRFTIAAKASRGDDHIQLQAQIGPDKGVTLAIATSICSLPA
jgi:hypothetical protein